jgi:hypothetical protein
LPLSRRVGGRGRGGTEERDPAIGGSVFDTVELCTMKISDQSGYPDQEDEPNFERTNPVAFIQAMHAKAVEMESETDRTAEFRMESPVNRSIMTIS